MAGPGGEGEGQKSYTRQQKPRHVAQVKHCYSREAARKATDTTHRG